MKITVVVISVLVLFTCCMGQSHDYSAIDTTAWVIPRTDTLDYLLAGDTLTMLRHFGNPKSASIAYPVTLQFRDGTIEADMAWHGRAGGYLGIAFRIKDAHHYEVVYFRPESSGSLGAIQYMPEKQTDFDWWDYEADKYQGKVVLPLHDWFHVRLVVKGKTVSVYVDHGDKPAMVFTPLDNSLDQGSVGFWLGNCQEGAFRNLTVRE